MFESCVRSRQKRSIGWLLRAQIVVAHAAIAGVELDLALRDSLLFFGLVLGVEPLLHLAFDLGVALRFCLLFLAGAQQMIRPNWSPVIRSGSAITNVSAAR